jgi:RNA polymerase sigma-70 factor (ECF subfamily)
MDPLPRPKPPTDSTSDRSLLRRLAGGQETAADVLYRRYADRIRALARARLPDHVHARLDADDVVQSVFRAFFESARRGLYQVPDGESLWRLLAVVTVNKVRSLHAYHAAARRDARATVGWGGEETALITDPESDLMELAVRDVMEQLPEPERTVVELRLEGYEVAEIATRTGRSKRSVERSLQKAREHLAELMGAKC